MLFKEKVIRFLVNYLDYSIKNNVIYSSNLKESIVNLLDFSNNPDGFPDSNIYSYRSFEKHSLKLVYNKLNNYSYYTTITGKFFNLCCSNNRYVISIEKECTYRNSYVAFHAIIDDLVTRSIVKYNLSEEQSLQLKSINTCLLSGEVFMDNLNPDLIKDIEKLGFKIKNIDFLDGIVTIINY